MATFLRYFSHPMLPLQFIDLLLSYSFSQGCRWYVTDFQICGCLVLKLVFIFTVFFPISCYLSSLLTCHFILIVYHFRINHLVLDHGLWEFEGGIYLPGVLWFFWPSGLFFLSSGYEVWFIFTRPLLLCHQLLKLHSRSFCLFIITLYTSNLSYHPIHRALLTHLI